MTSIHATRFTRTRTPTALELQMMSLEGWHRYEGIHSSLKHKTICRDVKCWRPLSVHSLSSDITNQCKVAYKRRLQQKVRTLFRRPCVPAYSWWSQKCYSTRKNYEWEWEMTTVVCDDKSSTVSQRLLPLHVCFRINRFTLSAMALDCLRAVLPDKFSNCSCNKLFQVHKMLINLELKQSTTIWYKIRADLSQSQCLKW